MSNTTTATTTTTTTTATTTTITTTVAETQKNRLVSLDALRGFDMFWIIGARALADGLNGLNIPGISMITNQLSHTKWNGFSFYDLIFPLFIFITGVSLVLSLQKRIQKGDDRMSILVHIFSRTAILFFLGIVYNGAGASVQTPESMRMMGVLQRSALCYLFASLLVLYTKPRTQAAAIVSILLGYWAIMRFIPVPGYGAGVWTEQGNLAGYVDSILLPGKLYYGSWDPEGLLSTIPAIATCLLGVMAGHWFRITQWRNGMNIKPEQRALYLFVAGIGVALLGLMVSPVFPINKKLWTSSFVLLTGGLSAMLMAAFYWLIDIRSYRTLAFPFVVIGMNSMFIYLAEKFIPFGSIAQWIFGGHSLTLFGRGQTLFSALIQLSLEGLLLLWLYHRKTFIRI